MEEFCPKEHLCYCDGYGWCFGGEKEYAEYVVMKDEAKLVEKALQKTKKDYAEALEHRLRTLREKMESMKKEAFERGRDPRSRALEAGRSREQGYIF